MSGPIGKMPYLVMKCIKCEDLFTTTWGDRICPREDYHTFLDYQKKQELEKEFKKWKKNLKKS